MNTYTIVFKREENSNLITKGFTVIVQTKTHNDMKFDKEVKTTIVVDIWLNSSIRQCRLKIVNPLFIMGKFTIILNSGLSPSNVQSIKKSSIQIFAEDCSKVQKRPACRIYGFFRLPCRRTAAPRGKTFWII